MSRSAIDATRFTATSPHAYSKPTPMRASAPSSSSTYSPSAHALPPNFQPASRSSNDNAARQFQSPPPTPGNMETPAQKVARLRTARQAAKLAEITAWDRIVLRGRVVADKAHRITVWGLMGFTVISSVIAVFAIGDMIIYNRRKRNAWYADQAHAQHLTLLAAIENEKANLPLTEDQTLILNRERIRFRTEEEKEMRKRDRWNWRKWMLGGLKTEDVALPEAEAEAGGGGVLQAVEDKRRDGVWNVESRPDAESVMGAQTERREAHPTEDTTREKSHQDSNIAELDRVADRMADRAAELGKKKKPLGGWFGGGT